MNSYQMRLYFNYQRETIKAWQFKMESPFEQQRENKVEQVKIVSISKPQADQTSDLAFTSLQATIYLYYFNSRERFNVYYVNLARPRG